MDDYATEKKWTGTIQEVDLNETSFFVDDDYGYVPAMSWMEQRPGGMKTTIEYEDYIE